MRGSSAEGLQYLGQQDTESFDFVYRLVVWLERCPELAIASFTLKWQDLTKAISLPRAILRCQDEGWSNDISMTNMQFPSPSTLKLPSKRENRALTSEAAFTVCTKVSNAWWSGMKLLFSSLVARLLCAACSWLATASNDSTAILRSCKSGTTRWPPRYPFGKKLHDKLHDVVEISKFQD